MSKHCIVAFGEALIDFLWLDDALQPFTGGAIANVAVAVSKLGGDSYFIGSVGGDEFGSRILADLKFNGVNTEHTLQLSDFPTAAAYVSIDDEGERSFSFSRHDTADMQFPVDKVPHSLFQTRQGIFHFGSNCLTNDYLTALTLAMVSLAKCHGWRLSFDVNLRHELWPQSQPDKDRIMTFMSMADFVKVSDEELNDLLSEQPDIETFSVVKDHLFFSNLLNSDNPVVVVTSGAGLVKLYSKKGSIEHQPQKIAAVDTTGAGDAFWGAFIHFVTQEGLFGHHPDTYQQAIEFAAACGAYSIQQAGSINSYPELSQLSL
ncbi:MAG: carbohydrate kinase family protein [Arenicella sp.]